MLRDCIGCRHHKIALKYNPAALTLFVNHKCTRGTTVDQPAKEWHGLDFEVKAPLPGTCPYRPKGG